MDHFPLKIIIILFLLMEAKCTNDCPTKCTCKRNSQQSNSDWIKIRCGDTVHVNHLEELDLLNIATKIVQLNLSRNYLTTFSPKTQLLALQKLDISKNRLTVLHNNQFIEVPNLKRLDISGNSIKTIETLAFAGLGYLERLKLNLNQISSIQKAAFEPLESLTQFDVSNNPLTCDCDLLWLLDWTQKTPVKLISNPKCTSPPSFKGIPLRKLQIGIDIHCKSPAGNRELPMIDITPSHSQVVFEGDPLKLFCRTPNILSNFDTSDVLTTSNNIEWSWLDSNPNDHFTDVEITNRFAADSGLVTSSLSISSLTQNHTGIWNCRLNSPHGNYSQSLMVIVISDDTKYCPDNTTANNKGNYVWPRTIVNYTVTLPCESIQLNRDISLQKATHCCSSNGEWQILNTSECAYVSETTKILQQFSMVNLSLTKGNIYESAKHFKNYTSNLKIFKDPIDLIYAIETVENYMSYLSEEKELGSILMDVLNNFIGLPHHYLEEVNLSNKIFAKIIKFSEKIAHFTNTPVLLHKSNIAIEEFPVKQEMFAGMTCTWYISLSNNSDRVFNCVTPNKNVLSGMQDRIVEASIQIPASLFYQLREQDVNLNQSMQRLFVAMFSNGKPFPIDKQRIGQFSILSSVVGVKLVDTPVTNLTEPIYIMLHVPSKFRFETTLTTPVWWDATTNTEEGGNWTSDGCEFSHEIENNLVFHCKQLGYYGLLQNVTYSDITIIGAKFRLSHPAIYVGSFILFISLFVVVLTYCFCYVSIQMPKKAKHSLINMWIAVMLLIFIYVFGIYQTEDFQLCQIIGLMLHYFTLCTFFWMCVGVTTMYKRLSKNETIELQDDELPSEEPIKKPILGLYLIGWGISLIVCGISGAVNMKEYATHSHCFLNFGPALSALIIPVVVLLLILSALFLLIRCAIYSLDANGHLSEGTQVTENVDLDLLEPSFPNPDHVSVRSSSTKTRSSEIEDAEHAPSTQLKAYIIFLIIYVLMWFSCALATVKPFSFKFEEDIFSIIYAILSTILAAFTLFFYCIARNDVRSQWSFLQNLVRKRGFCFRSRNVSDATQNVPQIQIQPLPLPPPQPNDTGGNNINGMEPHIGSRSSSRSSSHTKSNSNNSNVLKAVANLNSASAEEPHGAKINNVNLVVLHRQQYRSNNAPNIIENPGNSAQMFYNPYQSTVARKFFKKQRQNMMKRNNLGSMRNKSNVLSDSASVISNKQDNSSIDRNIFGTNSKVNNTNIHVEHVLNLKQRNPNVFSDSHEEISLNDVPIEKLMMNAERLRRRELNRPRIRKKQNVSNNTGNNEIVEQNNMRTVSQQCSLEYSSDTTSILDKSCSLEIPAQHSNKSEDSLEKLKHAKKSSYKSSQKIFGKSVTPSCYEPSDLSIVNSTVSELSEAVPRIFINPSHDLFFSRRVQSRASSVSTSELDELYQQIRRGTRPEPSNSRRFVDDFDLLSRSQRDRRISDPEVSTNVNNWRLRSQTSCSIENLKEDNVETVV